MRVRDEVRPVSPVRLLAESSDRISLDKPRFRLLQLLRQLKRRTLRNTARVTRRPRAPPIQFSRKHLLLVPVYPPRWPEEPSTPVRICNPFPELRAGCEQTACPSPKPRRRRRVGRELSGKLGAHVGLEAGLRRSGEEEKCKRNSSDGRGQAS